MAKATNQDKRHDNSLDSFKNTLKFVLKCIDFYASNGWESQRLKQSVTKIRPIFVAKARNYIDSMRSLKDSDLKNSMIVDSDVLIVVAFVMGVLAGGRYMADYIKKKIGELLKDSTVNARQAALKRRTPTMCEKKKITIDAAQSYINNNPSKIMTRNGLMVQIRSDIEKKCKLKAIETPSQTSISNYLKEAKLPQSLNSAHRCDMSEQS